MFMETAGKRAEKKRHGWQVVAALGAAVVSVSGVAVLVDRADPQRAFGAKYTERGKCLDETPYDPENGAVITVGNAESTNVLAVIPRDANSYNPAVLFFSIDSNGLSAPALAPADYATGSFLHTVECPDTSDGY